MKGFIMLSKYDYALVAGAVTATYIIIQQMIEIQELKAKSKGKNDTILKLVRVNLFYADKMDKSGVPMTEFDKIAVNDIMS